MTDQTLPELPCAELVEVVTDYLEQHLSATDRARFDAHLLECEDCAEYLEQMRRTVAALGRLPLEALDPAIVSALPEHPPDQPR